MRVIVALILFSGAVVQQPSLDDVLERVRRYAGEFEKRFAGFVSEERYEQRLRPPDADAVAAPGAGALSMADPGREQRRVLRSDFLLVRSTGGDWMPFRDVFEVDGKPVRDRQDRLTTLFIKPSDSTLGQAIRIADESARYNIGDVQRTINVPSFAILLMRADRAKRFDFRRQGQETLRGRQVWRIDLRETARPTIVKTPDNRDLPVSGTIWADLATGAILRTTIKGTDGRVRGTVTVTFAHDAKHEMWLPSDMEESYEGTPSGDIRGKASYANYRRFQVSTSESVGKPPGS